MSGLKFFSRFRPRGGVHPEGRKELSAERPIRALPMPERLFVPLQQHIGAPAEPVVRVGDRVLKGQLIGAGGARISAPVHAPTSGRVEAVGDHPAPHPSGLPVPTITIASDGEDRWLENKLPADPYALAPEAIAERVAEAGIVGLGGAAFPSAVKLDLSRKAGVRTLIINGGECEPYLTCDDRIMRERADDIVSGIRLIARAAGCEEVLVGIENNKPEAIDAMRVAAAGSGIQVLAVPAMYPMGWDKQMTRALLGREVPAGGRSSDIGVLVHNVATAYAVHQAVALGRPLVSRIVTVSGAMVRIASNLEVPIGAPASALFEYCGGFEGTPTRLVMGGPMMGHEIADTGMPVVKGTSGVLALAAHEIGQPEPAPCIRCSTCVRACPVGLLPLEMAAHIRAGDLDGALDWGLKDCIACGSCAYVCPSHVPLVHWFAHARGELAERERAKQKQEAVRELVEARNERMERIARERAEAARLRAERKAAREAAKKVATEAEEATV